MAHRALGLLRLLTPNWLTRLPGFAYEGPDPDGYMTAGEVADLVEAYAADGGAPIRTGTTVTSVRLAGGGYAVEAEDGSWSADAVVVASGACNVASVPPVREAVPPGIARDGGRLPQPRGLPDGGVLIVGASSSGVQIADELLRSGREVGRHRRAGPAARRYRGADILWWMEAAGVLDERYDQMDDLVRAQPAIDAAGWHPRRRCPRPQRPDCPGSAARRPAERHPRRAGAVLGIAAERLRAGRPQARTAARHPRRLGRRVGLDVPEPPERLLPTAVPSPPQLELDLRSGEIRTILWATGYRPSSPGSSSRCSTPAAG